MTAIAAAVAAAAAAPALAADPPDLSWHTIDAGGSFTSGQAGLRLSGTIGQPDVGILYGDDLSLEGGFWATSPDSGGCMADWDGNDAIEPADVAQFVTSWFADLVDGTLLTDLDGSGTVEPADMGQFINAWFAALNGGC